ncbi:PD-(D/E)XK nuclease family protein [Laceyella putida]|uniref:PD-(D/E)XK nuclease family protein n=1 Tax=Laceyella putida TaxID=110101 RepID=A0ABW2RFF0_9BACL
MPMKRMPTYPEWSWSQSRHHLFEECKRKYYYHYYASYPGWQAEAPEEAKRLYRLKQLRTLTLMFGEVIHRLAQMVIWRLRQERVLPTAEELLHKARTLLNQAVRESRDKELWWEVPTKRLMLQELYYGDHLPTGLVEDLKERLSLCVHHLLQSRSLREYGEATAAETVEVEQLNKWILEETKVYVKVDWIYRVGEKWVIVDWKTGQKEENHEAQLKWYALYLHQCYHVPLSQIELRTEYLLTGACERMTATEQDVDEALARMNDSMEAMKTMLSDRERNAALPEEAFPMTQDERKCQWCNFQEFCYVRR